MKWLFFVTILAVIIGGFLILNGVYKLGYEVGKRSIILNPKGTISDLINDFKRFK